MSEEKVKRESISKRTRFEVFKRDSFSCQYCGQSAPEVLLVIDHIIPVSKGGKSDILNLITACQECNSGKSDVLLSDNSEINKKKAQLDLINEKKNQLEMMYEWQSELIDLDAQAAEKINDLFEQLTGFKIINSGLKNIKSYIKKYGFAEVAESLRVCVDQYIKFEQNGVPLLDSVDFALSKIRPVLENRRRCKEKPYLQDLFYIRAIICNRGIIHSKDYQALQQLENLYLSGVKVENMKAEALRCINFDEFCCTLTVKEENDGQ